MILKSTGDNFRSTGRATIDQHDHRLAVDKVSLACVEAGYILRIATAGRNNFTLVEERV
ncbi:hypothetical protein FQZ97_870150 [compost metagenome]